MGPLLLLIGLLACGRGEADRLLYAALEGEETDMTREEQIALLDRAIALEPTRVGYRETRFHGEPITGGQTRPR